MTVKFKYKIPLLLILISGGYLMYSCLTRFGGGTAAYIVPVIIGSALIITLVCAVGTTLIHHYTIRVLCDAVAMRLAPAEMLHNKNRRPFFRALEALFENRHNAAEQMFLKLAARISDSISKSDKFDKDNNSDIAAYCAFWAAKCALATENYDTALQELALAETLKPNYGDALHEIGKIYFSAKLFDKSAEYFKKAERFNANDKKACFWLASIYDRTNEYDKAVSWIEHACKIDSTYTPVLSLGAVIYKKIGLDETADSYFRKAVYAGLPSDYAKQIESEFDKTAANTGGAD